MTVTSQSESFETVVDGIHFGECLRWRDGLLYFVDMYGDAVMSFDPASGERRTVGEVFHPGGIGWLPDGRLLAVASEDKAVFAVGEDGNTPYVDLSAVAPGWTNDMFVGRDGRAYVGNFGYDLFGEEMKPTELDHGRQPTARSRSSRASSASPTGWCGAPTASWSSPKRSPPGWRSSTSAPTGT